MLYCSLWRVSFKENCLLWWHQEVLLPEKSLYSSLHPLNAKSIQKQSFADVHHDRSSQKFCNIRRKIFVLEFMLDEIPNLKACNFTKKRLQHTFTWEYFEVLKNSFFIEQLWWMLLSMILFSTIIRSKWSNSVEKSNVKITFH